MLVRQELYHLSHSAMTLKFGLTPVRIIIKKTNN
jgi:hypothetical protein